MFVECLVLVLTIPSDIWYLRVFLAVMNRLVCCFFVRPNFLLCVEIKGSSLYYRKSAIEAATSWMYARDLRHCRFYSTRRVFRDASVKFTGKDVGTKKSHPCIPLDSRRWLVCKSRESNVFFVNLIILPS